jgi:hypothetical protein
MSKIILMFFLLPFISIKSIKAQDVTFGGYVDACYAYDTDKNGNSYRQFSGIAPYRDEFRINSAQKSKSSCYTSLRRYSQR